MEIIMSNNNIQITPNDNGIFIIGAQRSGTTLLRMILNAHPQVCSGEETRFLNDFEKITDNYWSHLSTYGLSKEETLELCRSFFLNFHHACCYSEGKQIWIEKTPTYIFRTDFINQLFPSSKFIHLIRDGRDVAASFRDIWGQQGLYRCLKHWPDTIKQRKIIIKSIPEDRYLEVFYEDLVLNPREETQKICSFLNLPWDESVLSHHKTNHKTRTGVASDRPLKPITKNYSGNWKSRVTWWERLLIANCFKIRLQELEYIPGSPNFVSRYSEKMIGFMGHMISKYLNRKKNRKQMESAS